MSALRDTGTQQFAGASSHSGGVRRLQPIIHNGFSMTVCRDTVLKFHASGELLLVYIVFVLMRIP